MVRGCPWVPGGLPLPRHITHRLLHSLRSWRLLAVHPFRSSIDMLKPKCGCLTPPFLLHKSMCDFHSFKLVSFRLLTRPNSTRKVRELTLFNVLCTVYCGRGCLSLEYERKGKEMRGCVSLESGIFVADDGTTTDNGNQRCSKRSSRT